MHRNKLIGSHDYYLECHKKILSLKDDLVMAKLKPVKMRVLKGMFLCGKARYKVIMLKRVLCLKVLQAGIIQHQSFF